MTPTLAMLAAGTARLGGGRPLEIPVLRIVLAFAACAVVAALAALLLRRRRGHDGLRRWMGRITPSPRAVEIVEVRRLSMHADIGVVRHAGREYLLLLQSGDSRLLSDGPAPEPAGRAAA